MSLEFTISIFSVTKLDKERTHLSELSLQEKLENISYFTSLKLLENYQLILLAYYFYDWVDSSCQNPKFSQKIKILR